MRCRSFLREENMADVTAKASSQSIAAGLLGTITRERCADQQQCDVAGTALGVVFSPLIGTDIVNVITACVCKRFALTSAAKRSPSVRLG